MLQVRFLKPPVLGTTQPKRPYPLREGAFDPRTALIDFLTRGTRIPRPRGLQRLPLVLGVELDAPDGLLGLRAARTRATGATVLLRKAHLNIGGLALVDALGPPGRGLPLRTADLLVLPIDGEVSERVRAVDFGLPVHIRACWAAQRDPLSGLTADE